MAEMSSGLVSAYLVRRGQVVNAIRSIAGTSSEFGNAITTVATLAKEVYDLIYTVISEFVGIIADTTRKAPLTLGFTLTNACKEIVVRTV